MSYVTGISGNLISAASAGYAPTNSADVSAIASAYATGKQDALTFGYDDGKISSIDGSALAGGGGGVDSATCSAIASAYAESAVSSVSGNYYTTANESGFLTAQAQASWSESASASPSYIQDKPDLVDIVAGPGIVVDNPDGNTLRVSMAADYEVVLWEGTPTTVAAAASGLTLSESPFNFERIMVYWVPWNYTTPSTNRQENIIMSKVTTDMAHIGGIFEWTSSGTMFLFSLDAHVDSGKFYTDYIRYFQVGNWTVYENGNDSYITKVVGIHRIANN